MNKATKKKNVARLLQGLEPGTERYNRTKASLETRTRPGEVKTVKCKHKKNGDDVGVPDGKVTLTTGVCPCSICGHQFMWECHEQDCSCCSSVCT